MTTPDSPRRDRRRQLALLLGIAFGIASVGTSAMWSRAAPEASPAVTVPASAPAMRDVVVAGADIRAGVPIAADQVAVVPMADHPTLADVPADPAAVIGRVSGVPIAAGSEIASGLLGSVTATGQRQPPDGWRVIALRVARDHAVSGDLAVGDTADLIVSISLDGGASVPRRSGSRTIDRRIPVAGISTCIVGAFEIWGVRLETDDYKVLVPAGITPFIALWKAKQNVAFDLALRSADEDPSSDAACATDDLAMSRFGFPYPRRLSAVTATPAPLVLPPDAAPATPDPSPSPSASASAAAPEATPRPRRKVDRRG